MKQTLALILVIAAIVLLFAGIIYYEISLWRECRTTNSFFYCVRILSR